MNVFSHLGILMIGLALGIIIGADHVSRALPWCTCRRNSPYPYVIALPKPTRKELRRLRAARRYLNKSRSTREGTRP